VRRGGPTGRSVVLAPDEAAWLGERLPASSTATSRAERHAVATTLLDLVNHRRHAQLINNLRDPAAVAARRPLCLLYVEGYGDVLFYASVLRCVFGAVEGDRLWATLRVQLNRYDVHTGEELVSGLREMALTTDELSRLRLFCIHDNDLQLLTAAAPGKRPGLFHRNDSNKGIQSCYHRLRFGRAIENYMTPVTMPLKLLHDPTLRLTLERMVAESLATLSKQFFAPFPRTPLGSSKKGGGPAAAAPGGGDSDAADLGEWLLAQASSKRAEAERQTLLAGWAAPSRAASATDPFWAGCSEFEVRMGNALCPTPLHATALLRLRMAVSRLLQGSAGSAGASEAMRAFTAAQRGCDEQAAATADGRAVVAETQAFIDATLQAHLAADAHPPPPPIHVGEVSLDEFAAFVRSSVGEAASRIGSGGISTTNNAKAAAGVRSKLLASTFFAFRTRAQQHDVGVGGGHGDSEVLRLPELLRYVSTVTTAPVVGPAGGVVRDFVEACASFLYGFTAAYFALFFPPSPANVADDDLVLARVAFNCTRLLRCPAPSDAGGSTPSPPPCRGLLVAWHPNASPDDCLAGGTNDYTRCVTCGRETHEHRLCIPSDAVAGDGGFAAAALCLLSVAAFDSHPYLEAVRGEPCLGQRTAGSRGVDDGADALEPGLLELHDACLAPLRIHCDKHHGTNGDGKTRNAAVGAEPDAAARMGAVDVAAADAMAVSLPSGQGRPNGAADVVGCQPMRAVVAAVYFWRAEELRAIAKGVNSFAHQ
jgi:hypothetical protein